MEQREKKEEDSIASWRKMMDLTECRFIITNYTV